MGMSLWAWTPQRWFSSIHGMSDPAGTKSDELQHAEGAVGICCSYGWTMLEDEDGISVVVLWFSMLFSKFGRPNSAEILSFSMKLRLLVCLVFETIIYFDCCYLVLVEIVSG